MMLIDDLEYKIRYSSIVKPLRFEKLIEMLLNISYNENERIYSEKSLQDYILEYLFLKLMGEHFLTYEFPYNSILGRFIIDIVVDFNLIELKYIIGKNTGGKGIYIDLLKQIWKYSIFKRNQLLFIMAGKDFPSCNFFQYLPPGTFVIIDYYWNDDIEVDKLENRINKNDLKLFLPRGILHYEFDDNIFNHIFKLNK